MKVRLFSLISLVLIVALLVPLSVSAEGVTVVNVTEADNGKVISLDSNSLLVLNLQSNPSTGYSWQIEGLDQKVLRQAGDSEFMAESKLLGAPATQVLRFQGVSAGMTQLNLMYRRTWEQERGQTFSIQVRTKGAYTGDWKPSVSEPVSVDGDNSTNVLPSYFNWCTNTPNGCTPVKNQGSCGSCWTFGTVGPLESNIKIKDGLTKDLAEQYLLRCNSEGWGCNGGWWAHDYHQWKYVSPETAAGSVYEADMPYTGTDGSCTGAPHTHREKIASWAYVGNDSSVPTTAAIKQAIYDYGALSVAVYVGSAFQAYTGGIFQTSQNGTVNHAVVLVGWDETVTPNHWIMRNSWGTSWGESGYMRIAYGTSQIGYAASYVVYNASGPTPTPAPPTATSSGGSGIVNGGFENGTSPWVQYSSGGYQLIDDAMPRTGIYGVWMGGYNNANEYIYQTITIPSNANLTYYWKMTSQEGTTYAYDYMYVKLYNTSGGLVATLRTRSNTASRGSWYLDTLSLASYAGQTLRIHFSNTTDSSLTTNWYLDDVAVQ